MKENIIDKLRSLYTLQTLHSKLDELHFKRGALPEQIADLEHKIAVTQQTIEKLKEQIKGAKDDIIAHANDTQQLEDKIKHYETQKDNVQNNREYEALDKEIETLNLSIQINTKRISGLNKLIDEKKLALEKNLALVDCRKEDLSNFSQDLTKIVEETQTEEDKLNKKIKSVEKTIESRLLSSYYKLRTNYRNKLAVVTIDRNACSGCHSELPPQKLSDIRQIKSLLVCEQCGRIMVDDGLAEEIKSNLN